MEQLTIRNEDGGSIRSYLGTLLAGAVIGGIAAGLAVQSCMHTPADMEATRADYQASVAALEATVDTERDAAADAAADADRHAREAERLRVELATMDLSRPEAMTRVPAAPLPPKVVVETPPEVLQRLHFFENVFAPQVQRYAADLETALSLERARTREMAAALSDMTVAYERTAAALAASEQAHAESKTRLAEWDRVSIPRRKALLIAGGTVLAVILGGKLIGG